MFISAAALFLTSAALLVYEILLMRIMSIEGWSHFAYMVVSLSMLGLGFSGVMIGLFPDFFRKNRDLIILGGGFSVSLLLPFIFYLSRLLPIDFLYIVWDPGQLFFMGISYLLYGLPFLVLSVMLAVFFLIYPEESSRVYSVNLLGSGTGIIAGIVIMHILPPRMFIFACSFMAGLASLVWCLKSTEKLLMKGGVIIFSLIMALNFLVIPDSLVPYISEYKGLSSVLRLPGVEIVDEYYSPRGVLHVLEGNLIRLVSGQSTTFRGDMPPQKALTFDGDSPESVMEPEKVVPEFFENLIFSAPYKIKENPRVLLVGAGGLSSAQLAGHYSSSDINVLEINPRVIEALKNHMTDDFKGWKKANNLNIVRTDARGHIEKSTREYDIIQLNPAGTFSSSATGLYSMNEDYLNTVEAKALFIDRLKAEGILMVSRWVNTPPKDGIKLLTTAVNALEKRGIKNPAEHIVLLRNWDTVTLMVKKNPYTTGELSRISTFCETNHFDISYKPGISEDTPNRFHILPRPAYYQAAERILDKERREEFLDTYIFNVRPATDDKPYFSHFFKWSAVPHLIDTLGKDWVPFTEFGYLGLLGTFLQAILIGGILILVPLFFLIKKTYRKGTDFKYTSWLYFAILGLGFMILEMGMIQKFILFLHDPIYAAAIVIGTFLIISGVGSRVSKKFGQLLPFGIIIVLAVFYGLFLDSIFEIFMGFNLYSKLFLSVVIISPLAFFMGMPFPMGMDKIAPTGELNTGIAWGLNGYFSVVGAIITPILAMTMGFRLVVISGGCLYMGALVAWNSGFKNLVNGQ